MQLMAWVAASLVFMSFWIKTIVPLRMLAIASNVAFIGYALMGLHYGVFDKVLPILVLHMSLLPLNVLRLRQVSSTMRKVRESSGQQQSLEFLIPYMTPVMARKGQILFTKGDAADRLYFLREGRVKLTEVGESLMAGAMFGEDGVLAEHEYRTSSAQCEEDCMLLSITGAKVVELFYQNPRFGFFMVRTLCQKVRGCAVCSKVPVPDLNELGTASAFATH